MVAVSPGHAGCALTPAPGSAGLLPPPVLTRPYPSPGSEGLPIPRMTPTCWYLQQWPGSDICINTEVGCVFPVTMAKRPSRQEVRGSRRSSLQPVGWPPVTVGYNGFGARKCAAWAVGCGPSAVKQFALPDEP